MFQGDPHTIISFPSYLEVPLEIWRQRWPHFTPFEMSCSHCGALKVRPVVLDMLEDARETHGAPIVVSSGYRCPAWNAEVSHTGRLDGVHTMAMAIDITASPQFQMRLLGIFGERGYLRAENSFITGLGFARTFLHADIWRERPRPNTWFYQK